MLCFEMQLMRVRLETDDPKAYNTKIKRWKFFRFVTLIASTIMNALQMYLNTDAKYIKVIDTDHSLFSNLDNYI